MVQVGLESVVEPEAGCVRDEPMELLQPEVAFSVGVELTHKG